MLSSYWALVPFNIRMSIYAVFGLIAIGGVLAVTYAYNDWQRLKTENKAQAGQIQVLNEYVVKYDKWTKVKEKGKSDGLDRISKDGADSPPAGVLVNAVNSLPVYGESTR